MRKQRQLQLIAHSGTANCDLNLELVKQNTLQTNKTFFCTNDRLNPLTQLWDLDQISEVKPVKPSSELRSDVILNTL